jgi:hypothetical protein
VKFRLVTALVLTGALSFSITGAQAATPVMDGKKVKVLTFKHSAGLQDNDKDAASLSSPDYYADCAPAKCGRLPFVYKPAKGAKGGLLFSIAWGSQLSDFDLYVVEVDKRGSSTELGHCASTGQPHEKYYLPSTSLKSGHTYAMVVNYFRSINDTVTGKIEMGAANTVATTVPSKVDDVEHLNCTL